MFEVNCLKFGMCDLGKLDNFEIENSHNFKILQLPKAPNYKFMDKFINKRINELI